MVVAIARKLAESKWVNRKLREGIYIHGVECACESNTSTKKNVMEGRNCFCAVDVDLLGTRKSIRTSIDQPTSIVSTVIDPKDFTRFADTELTFKSS